MPEGGVGPTGTQLVPGNGMEFDGLTPTSNLVIYSDTNADKIDALPFAGGTPTLVGTVDSNNDVNVVGEVVLFQSSTSQGIGAVSSWKTGATSASPFAANTFLISGSTFVLSSDGTSALVLDNIDPNFLADLILEHTDGSNKITIDSKVDLPFQTSCPPQLVFGGDNAFVAYCPPVNPDAGTGAVDAGGVDGGDGGAAAAPQAVVKSFTGASWTEKTIVTGVNPFLAVDSTGAHVLVSATDGLYVYAADGTGKTLIDANGTSGRFTKDGQSVLYTTTAGALADLPGIASPSPTTLSATDFAFLQARSPDGNWVMGSKQNTQNGADLYLSSTSTTGAPHTPVTLVTTTDAFPLGDAFTADSSQALYMTSLAQSSGSPFGVVGTLSAMPTAGGTAKTFSTSAWTDNFVSGTKVVYADNPTAGRTIHAHRPVERRRRERRAEPARVAGRRLRVGVHRATSRKLSTRGATRRGTSPASGCRRSPEPLREVTPPPSPPPFQGGG